MSSKSNNNAPPAPSNNNAPSQSYPTVVEGHQHHHYAQSSDRYTYIGKDMSSSGTEPAFLDYGPKGGGGRR